MILTDQNKLTFNENDVKDTMLDGATVLDNEEVVILTSTRMPYTSKFSHYSKQGKLIKDYHYKSLVQKEYYRTLNSLAKDQVLFLLAEINKIGIINFRTGEQTQFDFEFKNPETFKNRLLVFPETKRYVIHEYPDFNKKYGRFTFFQYPHQQLWRVEVEDTFIYSIRPLNLSNSLVFFKDKVEGNIQFFVIDSEKKEIKKYSTPKPVAGQYKIRSVIELKPLQLYMYLQTPNNDYKHLVFNCSKHDEKVQGVLRKFKTPIPQKLYEVHFCGQYLYFFEYELDEKKEKALPAPILMVKRDTEEIVFKSKGLIRYNYNYCFSTEGENKMYLFIHNYHNCKQIEIKVERLVKQKELYFFMLTKLGNFSPNVIESILEAFDYDE